MAVNVRRASQVACKVVDLRAVKKVVEKRMRRGDFKGTSLLELQKREVDILQKLCHVCSSHQAKMTAIVLT